MATFLYRIGRMMFRRRRVVLLIWLAALVAVGVSLSLWATGVLELDQAYAGFGDPTVVFIAAMFVVADSLDRTGVTAWFGEQLLRRAGAGGSRILVVFMVLL